MGTANTFSPSLAPSMRPTESGSESDESGSGSASSEEDDLILEIDIGDTLVGMVGDLPSDSITFELDLDSEYETLTISTCSDMSNQFDTTLTLFDSNDDIVAMDTDSCSGNSQQAEIVLSNVAEAQYLIVLDGLNNAVDDSDLWVLSVSGALATTTVPSASPTTPTMFPTGSPTDSPTDNPTTTTSTPTTTTATPTTTTATPTTTTTTATTSEPSTSPTTTTTRRGSDSGSGSGSGSGSDSSDDMMSLFFGAQKVDENESELLGDKVGGGDGEEVYQIVLNFNKSSWMNAWGIFGVVLLMNAMCIVCYFKKKKQ